MMFCIYSNIIMHHYARIILGKMNWFSVILLVRVAASMALCRLHGLFPTLSSCHKRLHMPDFLQLGRLRLGLPGRHRVSWTCSFWLRCWRDPRPIRFFLRKVVCTNATAGGLGRMFSRVLSEKLHKNSIFDWWKAAWLILKKNVLQLE